MNSSKSNFFEDLAQLESVESIEKSQDNDNFAGANIHRRLKLRRNLTENFFKDKQSKNELNETGWREENKHHWFHCLKIPSFGIIAAIIVVGGYIIWLRCQQSSINPMPLAVSSSPVQGEGLLNSENVQDASDGNETSTPKELVIDVCGAVNHPKVVRLPLGSRVQDAIVLAGGFTEKANSSVLNQARLLNDGEKIYVPEKGESIPEEIINSESEINESFQNGASSRNPLGDGVRKINLNSASAQQLETLPKIGSVLADRIIEYRAAHGGFKNIEELRQVNGIGVKLYAGIKDLVTI